MAHLLGHVDRIVEADKSVERKDRACQDGRKYAYSFLELEGSGRLARAGAECYEPYHDYKHQAGDLDTCEDQVEPDRLGDAVEVDKPDHNHENERGENARHVYELQEVVAREGQAQNTRRSEAGRRNGEGHHKANERVPKGVVDVGG